MKRKTFLEAAEDLSSEKTAAVNPLGFVGRGAKSLYTGGKNLTRDAWHIAKSDSPKKVEDLLAAQRKTRTNIVDDMVGGTVTERVSKGKNKNGVEIFEMKTTPTVQKELDLLGDVYRDPAKNFRNTSAGSTPIIGDIAAQVLAGGKKAIDESLQGVGKKVWTDGGEMLRGIGKPGNRYIKKTLRDNPTPGAIGRAGQLISGSRGRNLAKNLDNKTFRTDELTRAAQNIVDAEKAKVTATRLGLAGTGGVAGMIGLNQYGN